MKTPEQDRLARWLIMTGKEWHWFPDADHFEPITPTAMKEEGSYPVMVDMGPGPSGADSVDGFLRDAWLNGSWALEVLRARDAEHASAASVAWEALERIAAGMCGDIEAGEWGCENDGSRDCAHNIARAALALRPGPR